MARLQFEIVFAPEVFGHLDFIKRRDHPLLKDTINRQLSFEPTLMSRNRKPLEQPAPFGATWELRLGPQNCFRVFYEVDAAARLVSVLAIGIKDRERLYVGGEEFKA